MTVPLQKVILMSIDVIHPNATIRSMRKALKFCSFMDAVILTDTAKHRNLDSEGIRIVNHTEGDSVFSIPDDNGRITHPDYELANLIQPSEQFHGEATHVLFMESDAGIVRPEAWTDEFLSFDFIGASWPVHRYNGWPPCDGQTNAVGNFGFSLRSKRFCELVAKKAWETEGTACFCSDAWACRTIRQELEASGIRYAPKSIADRFSCENKVYSGQFGFHGRTTMVMNKWQEI